VCPGMGWLWPAVDHLIYPTSAKTKGYGSISSWFFHRWFFFLGVQGKFVDIANPIGGYIANHSLFKLLVPPG